MRFPEPGLDRHSEDAISDAMITGRAPRKSAGGVTMRDVAERAGVSQMTVSSILNGQGSFKESTRNAVMKAVQDLGYTPNLAARRLASAESDRIGVLLLTPATPFMVSVVTAAVEASGDLAAQLQIERWTNLTDAFLAVRKLIAAGTRGILVPPPLSASTQLLDMISASGAIPISIAPGGNPPEKHSCVWMDDCAAAREMTAWLIGMGHRRIAFITGASDHASSDLRLEGYRIAMSEAGLAQDCQIVTEGDYKWKSGIEAAELLLSSSDRPTAIFASNDDMAAAVLSHAHGKGISVPGELSVVGFDDTILATSVWPQLTTVRQPIREMVELGAGMLLKEMHTRRKAPKPVHRKLDFTIVTRESAAPPR